MVTTGFLRAAGGGGGLGGSTAGGVRSIHLFICSAIAGQSQHPLPQGGSDALLMSEAPVSIKAATVKSECDATLPALYMVRHHSVSYAVLNVCFLPEFCGTDDSRTFVGENTNG